MDNRKLRGEERRKAKLHPCPYDKDCGYYGIACYGCVQFSHFLGWPVDSLRSIAARLRREAGE